MPESTSYEFISHRWVVLGLGNLLYGDEGFGIHAMRMLMDCIEKPDILAFVDGGVLGLDLLPLVETSNHLLLLDAVDAGKPPGTVVELDMDQIPLLSGIKLSEHQLGFQEVLALAFLRGNLPTHLHLIGVQPASMTTSIYLSQEVSASLPEVIRRSNEALQSWGLIEIACQDKQSEIV